MSDTPAVAEQTVHDRAAGEREDKLAIAELLQNWVIWRDAGDWERFATVWHEGARMNATWFRASAEDFIAGCRRAFDSGAVALHTLGGISIDVRGDRAMSQCKMQIVQRGEVDGVTVDVTCLGRFVDALEKRNGRWGIVLRQPVYELDRMTPVDPATTVTLDDDLLRSFPGGYRHLAYLQTKMGFTVSTTLPGTRGSEIEVLMGRMTHWVSGEGAQCLES
jgi:hypothetical protein